MKGVVNSNQIGGILDSNNKKGFNYNNFPGGNMSGYGILNRIQNNNNGPVKVQSNDYLKKPMTPDTSTITRNNNLK